MRRALIAVVVAIAAWTVAASAWTGSDDFGPLELLLFAVVPVATVAAIALLLLAVGARRAGRA